MWFFLAAEAFTSVFHVMPCTPIGRKMLRAPRQRLKGGDCNPFRQRYSGLGPAGGASTAVVD